jgi:hypothetical protein
MRTLADEVDFSGHGSTLLLELTSIHICNGGQVNDRIGSGFFYFSMDLPGVGNIQVGDISSNNLVLG